MKSRRNVSHGQAVLLALVFVAIFFTVSAAFLSSLTSYATLERRYTGAAEALALAEAGMDKAARELNNNAGYSGETGTALGSGTFSVTVTSVDASTKSVTAVGYIPNATNPTATARVSTRFSVNAAVVSFRYGVQVGAGGVSMGNGSEVEGSLVSDGSVSGGGTVTGDLIVASSTPTGSISDVSVGGNAYAHTLISCVITGDAFYASSNSCVVKGVAHPGSADQPSQPLPITNAQLADFKAQAAEGGVISGGYTLSNNKSATLGPKEITGDFSISNGATVTLTGTVYVHGSVSLGNNTTLTVSPALGASGAVLIADGSISLSNGATSSGNGTPGSTLMLLSTAQNSAISVSNNAVSVIFYASNGTVSLSNNTHAKQITAYRLQLQNNATVEYDQGLQSQGFSNGPGGSWTFVPGTYAITP